MSSQTISSYAPEKDTETKAGLVISAILIVLLVGSVYISQLVFQEISKSFAIDILDARFIFSLSCFFYAIAFFIYGPLSDTVATKKLVYFGSLGTIVCLGIASIVSTYYIYLCVMSLVGFFSAAVPAALFAWTARNTPAHRLTQSMGMLISASIVGIIFSRSLVAIMTDLWSWQTAFLIYAVMIVAACLLIPVGINKTPVAGGSSEVSVKDAYKTAAKLLLNRTVVIYLTLGFILFFVYLGISSFLTFYLKGEPFNLSSTMLGWLNFAGMSAIVGAIISSRLALRMQKKTILILFLSGVLLAVLMIGYSTALPGVALGIFLLFLFVFGIQPVVISVLNQAVPYQSRGAVSSLYLLSCLAGGSIGTYILGIFWEYIGWDGIIPLCFSLIVVNIMLALSGQKQIKS